MMEVEKATAGRMIDRLVANGWVERRRTQRDDRRVKRVYLTPEAERVHKRIWRVAEATVEDRARRSLRAGKQAAAVACCSASRRRWSPPGYGPGRAQPWSPAGIPLRAATRRLNGEDRAMTHAPAKTGADRRAGARRCRRAGRSGCRAAATSSTENAFVKADITQIASEVPGRIIEVRIRDHSIVKAGDVLVRLDPAPYQLALAKAEAESIPRAPPSSSSRRACARSGPRPTRPRTS